MHRTEVISEIELLEKFSKQGESYTNSSGSYGWRNPIRSDTGIILQSLVIAEDPVRILEIGTAHGLSALDLALGMNENCFIDTIEFDHDVGVDTQERFDRLEVPEKVHIGEALDMINKLEGTYDLIFFDAQKSHYKRQLDLLLEKNLVKKGTLLLADNVIDRSEECAEFLHYFLENGINHTIIQTECGLLVGKL